MKLKARPAVYHRVSLLFAQYPPFVERVEEYQDQFAKFLRKNQNKLSSKGYLKFISPCLEKKALALDREFLISYTDEEKTYAIELLKNVIGNLEHYYFNNYKTNLEYDAKNQKIVLNIHAPLNEKEFASIFRDVQIFQESFIDGNYAFDTETLVKKLGSLPTDVNNSQYRFRLKLRGFSARNEKNRKARYKALEKKQHLSQDEVKELKELRRMIARRPLFKYQSNPKQFSEDFEILRISLQSRDIGKAKDNYRKLALLKFLKEERKISLPDNVENESLIGLLDKYLPNDPIRQNLDKNLKIKNVKLIKNFDQRLQKTKQLWSLV